VPGVYLSYPFCAQKCSYCNFASGVFPKALEPKYLDRLRRELGECRFPWIPETVYWGGGTPSLIDPGEFTALMAAIPGRPWREATLEAAPGTITREKAVAWAGAGIDRISLGVQSFVESEIRRTGRKHTAEVVKFDVETLRSAGVQKINIDLIAGLAGQTRESWQASLDALLDLRPDHASVYMLEVDEDSRLGKELTLGGVRYGALDVPADEQITEFYETAVAALAAAGLARYEISNFALAGHESLHNLKYWRREPYFGFGADAHSFDGSWRWANCDSPAEYADCADPVVERTRADSASERLFLGLRLAEGVPAEGVGHLRFEDDGLLERSGGRLRLTPKGILLSNEVFQEFVA
jgi:oxygen-independent coproporphyrinogen III oxidase